LRRAASRFALAAVVALAACRSTVPLQIRRMPDPTRPPLAGPALTSAQLKAAREAVAAAEAGQASKGEKSLQLLPAGHPVRALAGLELAFLRGEAVLAQAEALAAANPGYGSAWGLVVLAARREGDDRAALAAARTASGLQPDAGWGRVASEIESALVERLVAQGDVLLRSGDAAGALAHAREALKSAPGAIGGRLLAVRALLALHDTRGAAELVPGLPDTAEGLELKGNVAQALGQWDLALEFYTRLPADSSHRCELISDARRRLRLSEAPPYLTHALAARPLRRAGLAAIIAWEVPALAGDAVGAVPVFEDVVQLQERRDIVTVARAGVIPGDPIARRFGPNRVVGPRELAATLDRLAEVLRRPAPRWCGAAAPGCSQLPETVDGEAAAALVRRVAGEGGDPCAQR
jgi:tetratricopeptide (TPR) repeat protein